jgi:glycosyltransferase involved in cell wall biosynthesis
MVCAKAPSIQRSGADMADPNQPTNEGLRLRRALAGSRTPALDGRAPPGVLRIAMIGTRGVPATFGGIERHVEELGARLAARGHLVTVFCRSNYSRADLGSHRGMRLASLPTVGTKHLDAIVHSAVSTVAAMAASYDVLHYHAIGPGMVAVLPRYLSRARVVLTVHGRDDERGKWGRGAKAVLGAAGWLSARVPDATIVVGRHLERWYREVHGRRTVYVPNGVHAARPRPPGATLQRLGLEPGRYLLFVGRLVPEKAPDLLLAVFRRLPGNQRLVLAGDTSFTDRFTSQVRQLAAADPRVVLPGYVYGAELAELYSNAAAFVLPSLLEGLPLTLLEAASYGLPVVASAIPPHLEVLGAAGPGRRLHRPGNAGELLGAIRQVLADPPVERAGAGQLRDEVLRGYCWDDAAERTEAVYRAVLQRRPSGAPEMAPGPSA